MSRHTLPDFLPVVARTKEAMAEWHALSVTFRPKEYGALHKYALATVGQFAVADMCWLRSATGIAALGVRKSAIRGDTTCARRRERDRVKTPAHIHYAFEGRTIHRRAAV